MSVTAYNCGKCGASFGIAGENTGSDEDYAAEEFFDSEVEHHESGQCVAAVASAAHPDPRAEYIAGLRALADALEANPDLPLPSAGVTKYPFSLHFPLAEDETLRAQVALLTDGDREWIDDNYYRIAGRIHGLHVTFAALASNVGRTVTREVETFEVVPFLPAVTS